MNANAADYDLVSAATLREALEHVTGGRRPIAGGTDLMVLFEAGRLPYRRLVSVRTIPELREIEETSDGVVVGACVTYSEIQAHPLLRQDYAMLCRAASWTGGVANQNRGTLGGNIANASPAADSLPALLAYGAEVELTSLRGARWIAYDTFHTGYKTTRMEPYELLTRIRLPRPQESRVEYIRKVGARSAQAISKIGMAALASRDCVRIAVASMAPVPLRCRAAENVLNESPLNDGLVVRARKAFAEEVAPIEDIRSTREYRLRVGLNLLDEFLASLRPSEQLRAWNRLDEAAAHQEILKCCGSARWARLLAAKRPILAPANLFQVADKIWNSLDDDDKLEAFRSHPRIGGSVAPTHTWEAREQSAMSSAGDELREQMHAANREYEARFGFTYIVRATGRTGREMLALLRTRLANDNETEFREASEQQRQIMQLRLRKWLQG